MSRTYRSILAATALVSAVACGRSDRGDTAVADSLNRDLQLAPVDSSAPLGDQPAADTATPAPPPRTASAPAPAPRSRPRPRAAAPVPRAAPAPEPAASPPAEAPAASARATGRSLPAGTNLSATTSAEIRSHKNKVGDEIEASVANDVKDAAGRVVIPAGSSVTLKVTAIKESENKRDSTGTLTLLPTQLSLNGQSYPINASIERVSPKLEGRGTNAGDIAKVGGGTAAGAVVGRVLGGSTKGAVIGGIIGGAVGAQRAVETKDRDVVLPQGTAVTIQLQEPFVARS